MSGMPSGAPDSVPRGAGIPYKRDPAAVPRAPHRDHRRAARPDQWASDEAMQRVLGEGICVHVCAL